METSIISVGIDIGTTTTSMIFSRLFMKNTMGITAVPNIEVSDKQILYKSDIYTTPLYNGNVLDSKGIRQIIENEYKNAGITPEMVDTGAIIITGESALKENADSVVRELSSLAGNFVVAAAGGDMESVIAAKGAGIEELSRQEGSIIANLDIGGGTTNIAIFNSGKLVGKTCIAIGGHLLTYDDSRKIIYVSDRLNNIVEERLGYKIEIGWIATEDMLIKTSDIMADVIADVMEGKDISALGITTSGSDALFKTFFNIDKMSVSGGVGECYYNINALYDLFRYKDIGVALANSLAQNSRLARYQTIKPRETMRATVIGAGMHTTTVSGSTISYNSTLFPIKNVKAIAISKKAEDDILSGKESRVIEEIKKALIDSGNAKLIICFQGKRKIKYESLVNMGKAIVRVADLNIYDDMPLLILVKNDMAKALGQVIRQELKERKEVVCIDSIDINEGDYIDMGEPLMNGMVIPVVVKTLIFN